MSSIPLQILWQINNINRLKRTLLDANPAPDTKRFGQIGDFRFGSHLDAQFAEFDDGTGLFAFLFAFFGFAFFGVDDGYAG
jgi:hypothetical protein